MEGGREDVNSFTMGIFSFELNSRVSGFFFFFFNFVIPKPTLVFRFPSPPIPPITYSYLPTSSIYMTFRLHIKFM